MKRITTTLTGLAALALAVSMPAQAAFTSKGAAPAITASATTGGSPTVQINSVAVKNISNNGTATALGWTNPTPGAGFLVSDQYIQMVSNINQLNGGIEIYTDNTNAAANPKFTGSISSFTATPAGLIGASTGLTDQKLPTAWRASTFTLTNVAPVDPNATTATDPSGQHFLWFFHEDRAQVAVPTSSAALFTDGDPFITVYAAPGTPLKDSLGATTTTTASNSGLHFAQGPTQFGGFNAGVVSTYIYTEADFTSALAGQSYSTNRIILEAFSL